MSTTPTSIAVTGASGFVGSVLTDRLVANGHEVCALVRRADKARPSSSSRLVHRVIPDMCDVKRVAEALRGAYTVIHLAARVHVLHDRSADPGAAYYAANVLPSEAVAQAATLAGVSRIVFVSSIKVNGERTTTHPFRATDSPAPLGAYSRSKLEAEQVLARICESNDLSLCIVRPPLVYGPRVRGNMLRLIKMVHRGVPLPFRSIGNQRSIVSVFNLAHFLERCAVHAEANGKIFLVADRTPISTPEMIRCIAEGMSRKARLVPLPVPILAAIARLTGRRAEISRLTDSLVVDISESCRALDWRPEIATQSGLREMARWFTCER